MSASAWLHAVSAGQVAKIIIASVTLMLRSTLHGSRQMQRMLSTSSLRSTDSQRLQAAMSSSSLKVVSSTWGRLLLQSAGVLCSRGIIVVPLGTLRL